ncbi:hypothetical protein MNBD_GAMMA02-19 [hydrothermal vent metagenome]|uniref:Transposase n=1 Tax=hydrothermal vent metagenome TaxID=652676 RepID=A0A3B0VQU6_9ZZZZ
MPTKKRNFTEEFREEAVHLALTSALSFYEEWWSCLVGQVCGDVKLCYVV